MSFGQLIIGPPGSGKTTYCNRILPILSSRNAALINLDPANPTSTATIDICQLITQQQVMLEYGLGPNASLVFCMEYLLTNYDWLILQINNLPPNSYLIFDLPGQVELFTHHDALKNIINLLSKQNIRLCTVHLIDSFHCLDASRYISMILLSLQTMLQLELPHINVLSKVDLISNFNNQTNNHNNDPTIEQNIDLDLYKHVDDLEYILQSASLNPKHEQLTRAIISVVQDYGLVGFQTLNIDNPDDVLNVIKCIDRANGYVFGGLTDGNESLFETVQTEY